MKVYLQFLGVFASLPALTFITVHIEPGRTDSEMRIDDLHQQGGWDEMPITAEPTHAHIVCYSEGVSRGFCSPVTVCFITDSREGKRGLSFVFGLRSSCYT
ncbi:hypothetical protein CHARACLAT_031996 [Characodon lateralis]|uniref:Uncharacterized protein n=1 Tax=Characodon lateralis TaxID=208331 RepID=A0ABU7F7T8_9TELE|nr:hypothetical protein [Characodon lateralis]